MALYIPYREKKLQFSFRPISILSVFGKVVERVMTNQMIMFLHFDKLLSSCQFGFRKYLCVTNVVIFLNNHNSSSFYKNCHFKATFSHFTRTLECWNQGILLNKLQHFKFSESSIKLLKSYLENRSQMVKIRGNISDLCLVNTGIPTGWISGTLIFMLYINDLTRWLTQSWLANWKIQVAWQGSGLQLGLINH